MPLLDPPKRDPGRLAGSTSTRRRLVLWAAVRCSTLLTRSIMLPKPLVCGKGNPLAAALSGVALPLALPLPLVVLTLPLALGVGGALEAKPPVGVENSKAMGSSKAGVGALYKRGSAGFRGVREPRLALGFRRTEGSKAGEEAAAGDWWPAGVKPRERYHGQ